MLSGRLSEEYIILFYQHKDMGYFSLDEAYDTVESLAADAHQVRRQKE